jgi:hypothetical protein
MLYKTIVLELIQEQYPALHSQLRNSRTLLRAVNDSACALKRYHEDWTDRLTQARPDKDPSQIASEALELAIELLQGDLPRESPPNARSALRVFRSRFAALHLTHRGIYRPRRPTGIESDGGGGYPSSGSGRCTSVRRRWGKRSRSSIERRTESSARLSAR